MADQRSGTGFVVTPHRVNPRITGEAAMSSQNNGTYEQRSPATARLGAKKSCAAKTLRPKGIKTPKAPREKVPGSVLSLMDLEIPSKRLLTRKEEKSLGQKIQSGFNR